MESYTQKRKEDKHNYESMEENKSTRREDKQMRINK
jgi:hypothetical protein